MLTAAALRAPRFVVAAAVTLALVGVALFRTFPSLEDPEVVFREAVVTAFYPGLSPERMENLILRPIEDGIRTLPEVKKVVSRAKTGFVQVNVTIKDRYPDMRPIWDRLRTVIEDLRDDLPQGTVGPIVNDDFGRVAVATIAITADGFSLAEMRRVVRQFRDHLASVPGVGRIKLYGELPERIVLQAASTRLAEFGLSPMKLATALRSRNVILPGGTIVVDGITTVIEPTGAVQSVEDLARIPISVSSGQGIVYLGDVMAVERTYADPPQEAAYFNGQRALVLAVSMAEGTNVVQFGTALKNRVSVLEPTLPVGFQVRFATFQPAIVQTAIADISQTLYQTLAVVLLTVVLFFGVRLGFLAGMLVPITILVTFAGMSLAGISLHRVSVAAIIISLGLLVDNGIVVTELIMRRLQAGDDRETAVRVAGRTLAAPLLCASLTTILAFLPLMMGQNLAAEYTRSLPQVITIALLVSWALSLTVLPVLCLRFYGGQLRASPGDKPRSRGVRIYLTILRRVLRYRLLFMLVMIGLLAGSVKAFYFVPKVFFPPSERNGFLIEAALPAGWAFAEMEMQVQALAEWLMDPSQNPEVAHHIAYVGFGGPRFVLALPPIESAPHRAFLAVTVRPGTDTNQVVRRTRRALRTRFPDIWAHPRQFSITTAEPGLIEYRIKGPDSQRLRAIGLQVRGLLQDQPGLVNVHDDWLNRVFKVQVQVDAARAARAGVTSEDVARTLHTLFSSTEISQFHERDQSIPIVFRGSARERKSTERFHTLNIFPADGSRPVPLLQVADTAVIPHDPVIRRHNYTRTLTVKAIAKTRSAAQVVAQLAPAIAAIKVPVGYTIEIGGEVEKARESKAALLTYVPLSLLAIVLLLILQFESYRRTAVILLTIPLGFIGACAGLLATGASFGFMATLGLLALAGIIVNNAILLIEQFDAGHAAGRPPIDAILDAAAVRLRPILVTTLTTIAGLVPLMLAGDAMWFGLAVVIAFGLAGGTVLTMGVVPVLLSWMFRADVR